MDDCLCESTSEESIYPVGTNILDTFLLCPALKNALILADMRRINILFLSDEG